MSSAPQSRRWIAAAILLVGLAVIGPSARAETPTLEPAASMRPAPAAHESADFDWFDDSRGREVPARLYWPLLADAEQPVPLVVFSHGIGGSRRGYSYLGRYFADHGIASLHVQHVGSDRTLWRGNPFGLVGRLWDAASEAEALARARDLSFALDQLLDQALQGRQIDRDRIAAAGHSYGANTAMLVTGANVSRPGQAMSLRDTRFRAALLLSAPPFYGEADVQRILGALTLPTLHVTATDDVIRIPGYYSPSADRVAVFEAAGSARKALAVFDGGSHSVFTDRVGTGGVQLNPRIKAATQSLAVAFLRSVFDGQDEALQSWPLRHRELIAQWVRHGP